MSNINLIIQEDLLDYAPHIALGLLGAAGAAYGGKKLYDKYNKKSSPIKTAGKIALGAGATAAGLYGVRKGYDYFKSPEGQKKVQDSKDWLKDKYNSAKDTFTGWFKKKDNNE